jgi:hypothetical protein
MDNSSIANLAVSMAQARTGDAVGIAVLKKAMDLQAQSALALINAIPNLPPHLGQNVNTVA